MLVNLHRTVTTQVGTHNVLQVRSRRAPPSIHHRSAPRSNQSVRLAVRDNNTSAFELSFDTAYGSLCGNAPDAAY